MIIDWSNTILLDDNQVIEYVIGTGIDITERKKAEEALARTLVDLKVILDNSPVGIAFLAEGQRSGLHFLLKDNDCFDSIIN